MARILILIAGHLCSSPRPQKEAETLANAGHDVTVRGCWFDPELVNRDRLLTVNKKWSFEPIVDFQPRDGISLGNLHVRLRSRAAKELFKRFNIFSPEVLGYGTKAMLQAARQARADLTIVHSEGGLWVGQRLLAEGLNVGVDFEDWFSEDLLPEARVGRPLSRLKELEKTLACESSYCVVPSHAMAEALASAYQAPRPTVIYNTFPLAERKEIDHQNCDRRNVNLPSLHWFSQTIGPGRGLETLLKALPYLRMPAEIHLRGNYSASSQQWLDPLVPLRWRDRLFIHTTVPNGELLSRISEHDIGLALESPDIPNRNFAATNKLFQYLQAGLAVIATDTAGQREVLSQWISPNQLVPTDDSLALARALEDLLSNPDTLRAAKAAAIKTFEAYLCWEKQADKLVRAVDLALNSKV